MFEQNSVSKHADFVGGDSDAQQSGAVRNATAAEPSDIAARAQVHADAMADLSPAERIEYLRRRIDGSIVFTHGFGVEGQLLFHWICQRKIDVDVVALDTGRLFPETYELWEWTERRYGRRIRAIYPNHAAVESLVAKQGINGFYDSKQARLNCCEVRKTKPLDRALAGAAAWIAGLRADQSATRSSAGLVSFDAGRSLIKLNPLFDWTRDAVLAEVRANRVPINSLHAKGFASIGCAPCTRAIAPGEPERNGRWWWENDGGRECGLHVPRNRSVKDNLRREHIEMSAGCG
jgi:phosphoadenosine phosphosulfate reductase